MNAALILVIITAAVALFAWWTNRSMNEWAVQREAAEARAQQHRESGSAWGNGAAAALTGKDFWENPHCTPIGSRSDALAWQAGWCQGRQQLRDIARAEP